MNLRDCFAMTMKARFPHRNGSEYLQIGKDGKYVNPTIEGNFKSFIDGWLTRSEYDAQKAEKADLILDPHGIVENAKKQIGTLIRTDTGGA